MATKKLYTTAKPDPQEELLPLQELMQLRHLPKSPKLQQALKLFRGEPAETICAEMTDFIRNETGADELYFLAMHGEDFEVISGRALNKVYHAGKRFAGMSDLIYKRLPVLLEKNFTSTWKIICKVQPEFLVLIPVAVSGNKSVVLMGTAVLVYYTTTMPVVMELEKTWNTVLDYLQLTLPLLVNVHKQEESENRCQRIVTALEALTRSERDIHDTGNCIRSLAYEISNLLRATYAQVLVVQQEVVEDKKLLKYCQIGTPHIEKDCPCATCHNEDELPIRPNSCEGYVAMNGKPVRANEPAELAKFGIQSKFIHSIAGCIVSNILCVPIAEHSDEAPLILELSEKPGGFSHQDEEQAVLFARRAATILSSALLLDYKKKAIRRHGIRNEVLANIGEVSHFKVKQLLDLKFEYSNSFRRKLQDFTFSMRIFPDHQSPGVVLYLFLDLGFVQRWKIRKSTLIRFILSMQQGYRDIPYHNWKHACSVTHFVYILLKKLELVKNGYLTDLEAFTLIISSLAHDIDHRGRNNHFNLCTKSELYHLYKQEDSIMERHHIAVALSVLNSEDCNIVQSLTDEEYREFLDLIQWNILATDLAKYMQNRIDYFYTLNHFECNDLVHRKHLCAIIMTTADLCDNLKRWDTTLPTVKSIFYEFFAQGDDEIALGLKPMPMMDRRVAYIPQIEIQFINNVVRPAYHALSDLLPQTRICLGYLDYFEDLWLVSTSIFDEHSHLGDPLKILDLKEMREMNLRKQSAPHLQIILEEHGIPALSIGRMGSLKGSSSLTSLKLGNSSEAVHDSHNDRSSRKGSIPLPPSVTDVQVSFWEIAKSWFCCHICRNKGLMAAQAVRKFRLEDEYLDKRVYVHEKRRSVDSGMPPIRSGSSSQIY